jgi:hypothetical protein
VRAMAAAGDGSGWRRRRAGVRRPAPHGGTVGAQAGVRGLGELQSGARRLGSGPRRSS